MKLWWIGSIAVGLLGAALVLSYVDRFAPQAVPELPSHANPEFQPAHETSPVVLQEVVDVSNIDALLDPPPIPTGAQSEPGPEIIRVGYDEPRPRPQSQGNVKPIPPSTDD